MCLLGGSRIAAAAALPKRRFGGMCSGSSTWRHRSAAQHLPPPLAAADSSGAEEGPAGNTAADELPLWRFLRQQGFSADSISCLQAAMSSGRASSMKMGQRLTERKLQLDVAPNIAALRAEGLNTASIERLFQKFPSLLTTAHVTFASALAALRCLAALLPDNPRAVQAPPGPRSWVWRCGCTPRLQHACCSEPTWAA